MLDLYKNIRIRRKELKMSQEELALKVGYTNRSTIATIESGKIDLPQSKIKQLADALQTTPGDLMGLEVPEFEEDHIELITLYSKLNKEQKHSVMEMLRSFANQS